MARFGRAVVVLAALAALAARAQEDLEPALLELDEEDYEALVTKNENVLVEVYMPWCGVCRMVAPEFERAAELARDRSLPVRFGKINAQVEPELAERMGVTRYPTFFLFRNGQPESFPMLTTGEAYVAGLARMFGLEGADDISPAKEYGASAKTEEVLNWLFWRGGEGGKLSTTLVLYAPPVAEAGCSGGAHAEGEAANSGTCGTEKPAASALEIATAAEKAFNGAARALMKNPNLRFAIVRSPSVMADFEIEGGAAGRPTLVLYKDHDEGRVEYNGELNSEDLEAWVLKQNVPMVALITHQTLQRYRKAVKHLALLFVREAQTEHLPTLTRLIERLQGVAYDLERSGAVQRGEFTIGIANGEKYQSWMEHYRLPTTVLPALGAEDVTLQVVYRMDDDGAFFATEAECAAPAAENLGHVEGWTIELSRSCGNSTPAATALAAKKAEQAALGVSPDGTVTEQPDTGVGAEWNDPNKYRPLHVAFVDPPVEPMAAWLAAYFAGNVQPAVGGVEAALFGASAAA